MAKFNSKEFDLLTYEVETYIRDSQTSKAIEGKILFILFILFKMPLSMLINRNPKFS